MRNITCMMILALLTGCTSLSSPFSRTNYYQSTVEGWRGSHISTLTQRWGTPDDEITAASGNTLYVYKTASQHNTTPAYGPSFGANVSSSGAPVLTSNTPNTNMTWSRGSMTLYCTAIFEVDKNNIIISTKVQGNSCYGDQNFASLKGNPKAPVSAEQ